MRGVDKVRDELDDTRRHLARLISSKRIRNRNKAKVILNKVVALILEVDELMEMED